MVKNFIESFAKITASFPENIKVSKEDVDDSFSEVTIFAKQEDAGKLIGKEGKMINALKTLVSGCKAKENRSYRIIVKVAEENN
jgi:predicted RNA-binding protein YlqC (UPF0109 family)